MIKMFHKIEPDGLVDNKENFLMEKAKNKSVLHLGCVDAGLTDERLGKNMLLHSKLENVCQSLSGVDIDSTGIQRLEKLGFTDLHVSNIEEPLEIDSQYDLVIAGEVIEHLSNPGNFLKNISKNISENGKLIITVPNAYYMIGFVRMFKFIETVHEDHVAYYSYVTMKNLLNRYNYEIEKWYGYSLTNSLIGFKKTFKEYVNKLFFKNYPAFGEGLIFVVTLK